MSTMKSEIWSQLPQELLEHILAFLPLQTLFNLRTTCKLFNFLLFSQPFISKKQAQLISSSFSSFLLLSHPQFNHRFPLYDPTISRWRTIPLTVPLPSASSPHLLSSSDGLLCFSLFNFSLLVCNPLSKSSRIIQPPTYSISLDYVTLIASSHGYKIFILSSGSSSNSGFVYDSKLELWTPLSSLNRRNLGQNPHQEGVFSNGYLYFTTPEPFSLVGFDLEMRGKLLRPVEELPRDLTFVRLINNPEGKNLYLVGGVGSHGISRSMKLWELVGRDWVERGSLPEMMCKKFMSICYHNYEHVYCFFHDSLICVCCYTWPEVLCYKVSTQSWGWLSKCPSLPAKWSCGFRWFSFVPDLYASV